MWRVVVEHGKNRVTVGSFESSGTSRKHDWAFEWTADRRAQITLQGYSGDVSSLARFKNPEVSEGVDDVLIEWHVVP